MRGCDCISVFLVRQSVSFFAVASSKIPIQSLTEAEYREQGRNSCWLGRADLTAADIQHLETINRCNPERPVGTTQVIWDRTGGANHICHMVPTPKKRWFIADRCGSLGSGNPSQRCVS